MTAEPTITSASKTGANDDNVIFGNEQTEAARLDMQHRVLWDANPKPIYAPIDLSKGGFKILDQATSSGIWIRDMQMATDNAPNIWIGTDIEDDWFPKDPPSGTSYHHQSMTEPWPKEWEGTFDLVHSRMALPGVGTKPVEDVIRRLVSLVKPGGWIQFVEMEWCDDLMNFGGIWTRTFLQVSKDLISMVSNGQGIGLREKVTSMLEALEMVDIEYKIIVTPFGALASDKIRETSEASLYATSMGIASTTKMLPPVAFHERILTSCRLNSSKKSSRTAGKCTISHYGRGSRYLSNRTS